MSVSSEEAFEQLQDFYVERKDNQWRSVANLLEKLTTEEIISHEDLIICALGLADQDILQPVVRKANQLSKRTGKAGRREAEKLALAALTLAIKNVAVPISNKIGATLVRISLWKKIDPLHLGLIDEAQILTREGISVLTKERRQFADILGDALDVEKVKKSFAERDEFFAKELAKKDNYWSVCIAGLTGQMNFWEVINILLEPHSFPYPYSYEMIAIKSCLSQFSDGDYVRLENMPRIANTFYAADFTRYPLLSVLTGSEQGMGDADLNKESLDTDRLAIQLILEILAKRNGK